MLNLILLVSICQNTFNPVISYIFNLLLSMLSVQLVHILFRSQFSSQGCPEGQGKDAQFFSSFLFCFVLFRATPTSYGGSQARGRIGAVDAGLHHSHSHTRRERHLQPTLQPTAMPDP